MEVNNDYANGQKTVFLPIFVTKRQKEWAYDKKILNADLYLFYNL